jgi:ribose 5-phosphate isomerase B
VRLGIGNDHIGFPLKLALAEHLATAGHTVVDFGHDGTDRVDYPVYALRVAEAVVEGTVDRGLVICGSGVGVSIAANKVTGVRCVCCSEPYSAAMSRLHNDTNMIAIGSRVLGEGAAFGVVDSWLAAEFEGGRHTDRVAQLSAIEASQRRRS